LKSSGELFTKEIQLLSSLKHPGIATVHLAEAGDPERRRPPYIVTELIEGVSILEYVEQENLDLRAKVLLFLQVCEALAFAHDQTIVHLDLKPDNILVAGGQTKLIDFGIGKRLGDEAAGRIAGTPGYMPPEQARGDVRPSLRMDVFGAGAVLHALLTGAAPVEVPDGMSQEERIRIAQTARARKLLGHPGIPSDLGAVVDRALEFEPAHRYATVNALHQDLVRFLEHREVGARKRSWIQRTTLFYRREGRWAVPGTLLMLALPWLVTFAANAVRTWSELRAERQLRDAQALVVDAFTALSFDETDEAMQAFEDAREKLPGLPEAVLGQALVMLLDGRQEELRGFLNAQKDKVGEAAAFEYLQLAADGTVLTESKIASAKPRTALDHLIAGKLLYDPYRTSDSRHELAAEHLHTAVHLADNDHPLYDYALAVVIGRRNGEEEARRHVERLRDRWGGKAITEFHVGYVLASIRDYPEAAGAFERAIELGYDKSRAYLNLSVARLGEAGGLVNFESCSEIDPDLLEAAERVWQIACEQDPGSAIVIGQGANLLRTHAVHARTLGQHEEAVRLERLAEQAYRDAIDLRDDFCHARANLASLYAQWGRTAEALEEFRACLDRGPEWSMARFNLTAALHNASARARDRGDFESALAYIADAVAVGEYPHVLVERGRLLCDLGHIEEAESDFKRALAWAHAPASGSEDQARRDKQGFEALSALQRMYFQKKRYVDMVELITPVAERFRQSELYFGLGLAHFFLESRTLSVVYYGRVLELDPTHSGAWNNRGEALLLDGRNWAALVHLMRAFTLKPGVAETHDHLQTCLAECSTDAIRILFRVPF